MTEHKPLPVVGYRPQSSEAISLVSELKELEERVLRTLEKIQEKYESDGRWVAIGRTHIQQGFMAATRAVFQPTRVKLPEDDNPIAN